MAKKVFINNTHIEGYVYEHSLEVKTAGPNSKKPGTIFINGNLSIATDDQMLNVVPVHFSYVTEMTNKGKSNPTFITLKAIIDEKIGSVMEHGKENAGKVRIDSSIGLNEWYDTRDDKHPLVSIKRNEGGFVHQVTGELAPEKERSTFDVDFLIKKVTRIEADPDNVRPERMILTGAVFDFKAALLPVEFSVIPSPAAMDYFENLNASPKTPVFTRVKGNQVSQTITKVIKEESAFGDASVKTTTSSYKDFVVNWALPDPYDWDTEETLLASELTEMISERETYLAGVKQRQDEWQASKNNALSGNSIPKTATIASDDNYNF